MVKQFLHTRRRDANEDKVRIAEERVAGASPKFRDTQYNHVTSYARLSAVAPQFEVEEGEVCPLYTLLSLPHAGRFRLIDVTIPSGGGRGGEGGGMRERAHRTHTGRKNATTTLLRVFRRRLISRKLSR